MDKRFDRDGPFCGPGPSRRKFQVSRMGYADNLESAAMHADRMNTQTLASISHELRTPLTLILAPLEKLLAEESSPERRRELELIAQNARFLTNQVNDLMQIAKLDQGGLKPVYSSCDLSHLVRAVAECFEGLATIRGIRYLVHTPPHLQSEVDPEIVRRILNNLLANAFEFTPVHGTVRCDLREDAGYAILEIADSGPGIAPADRQRVFERFQSLDTPAGARRFSGLGLGLSIVWDGVHLHKGQVTIGDAHEGGALITVTIPRHAPAGTALGRPEPERMDDAHETARILEDEIRIVAHLGPVQSMSGRPRILIVEDTPAVRGLIARALAGSYQIETAADGLQGLQQAQLNRPDLIISDLMMPHMSGQGLIAALQKEGLGDIPVVVVTANLDETTRVDLFRAGAVDYLPKPFSLEELRVRVRNHVKAKRAGDMLRQQIRTQSQDLEVLAHESALQKAALEHTLAILEAAKRDAEDASRVKSDFLGLVSHELRTPLTTLGLFIAQMERQKRDPLTENQHKIVGRLRESTNRLINLVDSLLEYTRIERGQLVIESDAIDLRALILSVSNEFRPQAERKSLVFTTDVPSTARPIHSDPKLLRLIASNLIGNAIKFTDQGSVTVRLADQGSSQIIEVRDTGPGIAAHDLKRVFEPFQHVEPLQSKHTPGFGLGLALVRQLVVAIQAQLSVTSKVDEGTTFLVTIPLTQVSKTRSEFFYDND